MMGDNRDNSADSRFAELGYRAGREPHRPLAHDPLFAARLPAEPGFACAPRRLLAGID